MAGGEGTRLRPLTSNQPKPMAPIVGKPCMQHIIELLRRHGFDDIVVTVMEISGQTARIGIAAPKELPVYREEIWEAVKAENQAAASVDPETLPPIPPTPTDLHCGSTSCRRPLGSRRCTPAISLSRCTRKRIGQPTNRAPLSSRASLRRRPPGCAFTSWAPHQSTSPSMGTTRRARRRHRHRLHRFAGDRSLLLVSSARRLDVCSTPGVQVSRSPRASRTGSTSVSPCRRKRQQW